MKTALASVLLLFVVFLGLFTTQTFAQVMSNGSFRIEMGNLNSIAGESSGSNYNLSITSGETASGLYSGTNYKVRAGFQYIPRGAPFSLSLSNTLIDFGVLSPTNPVTRTTTLTISNTKASSYQVTASENHQLIVNKTGAIIPDTTCDGGNCNQTRAGEWSNTLTYGFGYRCDAVSIASNGGSSPSCVTGDSSFSSNKSYFKQFADASKKENSQVVVKGGMGRSQKATVTYKVNIPSSQATGNYTNAVTYVATPNF
ncbi:MAG: hypothetical protein KBD51_02015 [Candidatus Levybacteria bacterium]|nr:hypothetical protein [Candidatus Levybacteria bacterium]